MKVYPPAPHGGNDNNLFFLCWEIQGGKKKILFCLVFALTGYLVPTCYSFSSYSASG